MALGAHHRVPGGSSGGLREAWRPPIREARAPPAVQPDARRSHRSGHELRESAAAAAPLALDAVAIPGARRRTAGALRERLLDRRVPRAGR